MKIMAVIPTLSHGGAERVLSLLSLEWTKSHDVIILAFDASCPAYCYGGAVIDLELSRPNCPLQRIRLACIGTLRLVLAFMRHRPDRIVGFMEPANLPSTLAATAVWMRKRLMVSVHHDPHRLPLMRRVLMAALYRLPAAVVAVSSGVAGALVSLTISQRRVVTIPNPVMPVKVYSTGRAPIAGKYILGAGRLHWDKGFDRLLRAFAATDDHDLRLVVVGDGEEKESLLELAKELGIFDRVVFPGSVSNVGEWYRSATCFVLTSRTEAFSMTIVEAMAHGCPVISFNCDFGPREIIDSSKNGILIEDGDIDALSTAMRRMVDDNETRRRLAARGYERVAAYEVGLISDKWISTMEAIDGFGGE